MRRSKWLLVILFFLVLIASSNPAKSKKKKRKGGAKETKHSKFALCNVDDLNSRIASHLASSMKALQHGNAIFESADILKKCGELLKEYSILFDLVNEADFVMQHLTKSIQRHWFDKVVSNVETTKRQIDEIIDDLPVIVFWYNKVNLIPSEKLEEVNVQVDVVANMVQAHAILCEKVLEHLGCLKDFVAVIEKTNQLENVISRTLKRLEDESRNAKDKASTFQNVAESLLTSRDAEGKASTFRNVAESLLRRHEEMKTFSIFKAKDEAVQMIQEAENHLVYAMKLSEMNANLMEEGCDREKTPNDTLPSVPASSLSSVEDSLPTKPHRDSANCRSDVVGAPNVSDAAIHLFRWNLVMNPSSFPEEEGEERVPENLNSPGTSDSVDFLSACTTTGGAAFKNGSSVSICTGQDGNSDAAKPNQTSTKSSVTPLPDIEPGIAEFIAGIDSKLEYGRIADARATVEGLAEGLTLSLKGSVAQNLHLPPPKCDLDYMVEESSIESWENFIANANNSKDVEIVFFRTMPFGPLLRLKVDGVEHVDILGPVSNACDALPRTYLHEPVQYLKELQALYPMLRPLVLYLKSFVEVHAPPLLHLESRKGGMNSFLLEAAKGDEIDLEGIEEGHEHALDIVPELKNEFKKALTDLENKLEAAKGDEIDLEGIEEDEIDHPRLEEDEIDHPRLEEGHEHALDIVPELKNEFKKALTDLENRLEAVKGDEIDLEGLEEDEIDHPRLEEGHEHALDIVPELKNEFKKALTDLENKLEAAKGDEIDLEGLEEDETDHPRLEEGHEHELDIVPLENELEIVQDNHKKSLVDFKTLQESYIKIITRHRMFGGLMLLFITFWLGWLLS